MTLESGLAPLSSHHEKGGAENGKESRGWLRDIVTHELNAVDRSHISSSGNVHCGDIEHVGRKAIVADVVAGRRNLAVEVGVKATHSKARDRLGVRVGGGPGCGKRNAGGGAVHAGVTVNEDIIVGPPERAEIDAADPNAGGSRSDRCIPACDVTFHH